MTKPAVHSATPVPDPALDLVLERIVDVPPQAVWDAWTTPEQITQWFTPAPWTTPECELDLRPGGKFRTRMRGPNGEDMDNTGCVLEVIPNEKFVWTGVMLPGFRPQDSATLASAPFFFTAIITVEPHGKGTKYTATVIHGDVAGAQKHRDMGFHNGWGTAFDQLVAMVKARGNAK